MELIITKKNMKAITIIVAAILISTNCFSQTLNDTIPYLKSRILPNISLYQDKPLSTLLDNIPYQIKGYNIIGGASKEDFTDTELAGGLFCRKIKKINF